MDLGNVLHQRIEQKLTAMIETYMQENNALGDFKSKHGVRQKRKYRAIIQQRLEVDMAKLYSSMF